MVRPTQLLHPRYEPPPTRPAATVLLLRDTQDGIEILMTRRSPTASFAPGAYVFPGGGIDAADSQSHDIAARRPAQSDLHLTQAIAAIRESFEELGVLLARRADGSAASDSDIAALDRGRPFAAQCRDRGLKLAADEVYVLAPVEAMVRPRMPTTAVACTPRNCVVRPAMDSAATRPWRLAGPASGNTVS